MGESELWERRKKAKRLGVGSEIVIGVILGVGVGGMF